MVSVSAAKAGGGISVMFPAGCAFEDVPADLMGAINHALRILGWQENAMEEADMPPRWMWPVDSEITQFFDNRKRIRDAKRNRTGSDADDDTEDEYTDNAYAARFK